MEDVQFYMKFHSYLNTNWVSIWIFWWPKQKLQSSVITPNPDAESVPIDLSKKHASDDLDRKSILDDKSNLLFDPLQTIQSHQQVDIPYHFILQISKMIRQVCNQLVAWFEICRNEYATDTMNYNYHWYLSYNDFSSLTSFLS